tara:strand:- start:25758 stop:25937 length:180 start_codon:yes stop_codon:yes gene_type:complete
LLDFFLGVQGDYPSARSIAMNVANADVAVCRREQNGFLEGSFRGLCQQGVKVAGIKKPA